MLLINLNLVDNLAGKGEIFSKGFFFRVLNPLPDMPILSSSNSAASKDIMSKKWTKLKLSDWVENIVAMSL